MLHNDGFQGRVIPTADFTDSQEEDGLGTSRNKLYTLGAVILSVLVGLIGGSRSRSVYESVVYGFMFFVEAIISELSTHVVTSVALKRSGHRFALFFALMAVTCVAVAILTVH